MDKRMETVVALREAVMKLARELGLGITDFDVMEEPFELLIDVRFRLLEPRNTSR